MILFFLSLAGCHGGGADSPGGSDTEGDSHSVEDSDSWGDSHSAEDSDTEGDSHSAEDSDTGGDSDTGSPSGYTVCDDGEAPWSDIQAAVDGAHEGDTITVCPGTWLEVRIDRRGVNLVAPEGPEVTIIDGGTDVAVTVHDVTASIQGFSLRGDPGDGEASGLWADAATVLLDNVWIVGTENSGTVGRGFAVHSEASELHLEGLRVEGNETGVLVHAVGGGSLVVARSVFRDNGARQGMTAAIAAEDVDTVVHNNVFISNWNGMGAVSVSPRSADAWVYNNVVWGNRIGSTGYYAIAVAAPGIVENNIVSENEDGGGIWVPEGATVQYNNAWGNALNWHDGPGGTGNLEANPRFEDPEAGDFRLQEGFSPCIDAGNPKSGHNDVDGSRNDMGAYGGPAGSS